MPTKKTTPAIRAAKNKTLSDQERAYVSAYCATLDYITAWEQSYGMTPDTGRRYKEPKTDDGKITASREVYKRPHVYQKIQAKLIAKRQHFSVTREHVLAELAKLAFANSGDFFEFSEKGGVKLKDSANIPRELLAAVASVSETTTQHGGTVNLKLHDKGQSLERLAKVLKLFGDEGGMFISPQKRAEEMRALLAQMDDADGLLPIAPTNMHA